MTSGRAATANPGRVALPFGRVRAGQNSFGR